MGGVPVFSVPMHNDVRGEKEEEETKMNPVIDILRDFQYGKNGSIEYKWSPYAQERYVQLFFQATTSPPLLENKMKIMTEFWDLLRNAVRSNNNNDKMHLFRLILNCRDRKEGKGSWSLSLHLMCVVLREDYMGFLELFHRVVGTHEDIGVRERLGCWRDFRELQFLLQKSDLVSSILPEEIRHAAVNDITEICVETLIKDAKNLQSQCQCQCQCQCQLDKESGGRGRTGESRGVRRLSMLGKWFPREKSKYGWLYNQIYRRISKDATWREALQVNSKSDLRALLSTLNKHLDTLEVKQCKRDWHKIDFSNISTSRLLKHLDSFMGKRNSDIDRRLCKKRFLQHVRDRDNKNKNLSYVCEDMGKLVHQAKMCIDLPSPSVDKEEMIDSLWNDHLDLMKREWDESMGDREALIYPMIDLSASMLSDALGDKEGSYSSSAPRAYTAIAIGLTLAHVSRQSSVILYGTNASLIRTSEEDANAYANANVYTRDQRHRKYGKDGKDRKYYSLCRMVKRIMSDSSVGSGSISRIDNAMNLFKQVHSSDHKYGYSAGDREYLVLLSDFQYSPYYKICNIRDIENGSLCTSQVNESLNSTIPVSTVISSYLRYNLSGSGSVIPHTVFWNMSSTSGFPGLSFFDKSVFLSGSNPRSFLHTIRPRKEKEKETERRDNVPKKKKRIVGYSSVSMQNVDGNNMMWSKTPSFYVYKSLLRRRYECT